MVIDCIATGRLGDLVENGDDISVEFASLGLRSELLKNVESLGYGQMTPIQSLSLPPILKGKDVVAQGKTGSGKTAAFGLGILSRLAVDRLEIQALVICPTRELADQVTKAIRQLARMLANVKVISLCGGLPMKAQLSSLEHGAHIVVGTPGRLAKHLRKGTLRVESLKVLVLDEGDRMLEMGFEEEVHAIIDDLPSTRQTLLFSATFPEEIKAIAGAVMVEPEFVKIDTKHDAKKIKQFFYRLENESDRLAALKQVLDERQVESTVIFCKTKIDTNEVAKSLLRDGYDALVLNGDLEQRERDEALIKFSNRSASILVATDVAARGLDIDALDMVVNYQLPRDAEVYIHRVGRTGRAGENGFACSFFVSSESQHKTEIAKIAGVTFGDRVLSKQGGRKKDPMRAPMVTLVMRIGRKQKLRPGNLLGVLTGPNGIEGAQVGKITIGDEHSYVAVKREVKEFGLAKLNEERWKGRSIRAWEL